MNSNMTQYNDLFVGTAKEYLSTLNEELLHLEKTPDDTKAIDAIFRAAHSLKGQSAAMGYEQTGYLCHIVEDIFYEVKEKRKTVDSTLADLLFRALDLLKDSVDHIEAESTELAIPADIAEQLKQATGLKTVGSGKSSRQNQSISTEKASPRQAETTTPPTKSDDTASPPEADTLAPLEASRNYMKSIPVKVEQLDDIVGSLEELMVHRLTMQALVKKMDVPALSQTEDKIDELIELIQYQVMKIRTVPLSMILDHFPRAVRDLGRMLHKDFELRVEGADLELDRTIVERLDEPLIHLIRNAADHGIENSGTITIAAHAERDYAVVSVSDNGAGINWVALAEKAHVDANDPVATKKALFSGVSTATAVSLISGRGVGLEAVKKTIEDSGGSIDVVSVKNKGTTFTLKLPLAVSVVRTLIVRVGSERYALAATSVDRSLKVNQTEIMHNVGQEIFRYEDQEIPLIRLRNIFSLTHNTSLDSTYAVIMNVDNERIAFAVDDVIETLETVIRPLPKLLANLQAFSGVTIVGDGSSVLLINPRGLSNE